MTVDEMRAALGIGDDVPPLDVVDQYVASLGDPSTFDAPADPMPIGPFALALNAIFHAPGSAGAFYQVGDDDPKPIRVIIGQPDRETDFGRSNIVLPARVIEIRRSDVGRPTDGAVITVGADLEDDEVVGGVRYVLFGEPLGDVEGLSHRCSAGAG